MSFNTTQNIKCPKCGQMHTMTVWNSITAKTEPDLKKDILERKINIFTCPDCSQMALMPSHLLYNDEDKKLMIYFAPCNTPEEKMTLFAQTKETTKDEIKSLTDYNLRFVTTYNELMEKILIFDAGFNDKVIEFLKMMILVQEPQKASSRIAMYGKAENDYIEFMVQDKTENQVYTSHIPRSTYDTIEKELLHSGVKFKSFDWEIVDLDYSSRLLTGMNNQLF